MHIPFPDCIADKIFKMIGNEHVEAEKIAVSKTNFTKGGSDFVKYSFSDGSKLTIGSKGSKVAEGIYK